MDRCAIKVEGLAKTFSHAHPGPQPALSGVNLTVAPGEIVAILGPNGSGKTTLLKILATLILPDAGEAWVGGVSVVAEPGRAKSQVSLLIADDHSFYARLTGRQNLEFFAALFGLSAREAAERMARAADLAGVASLDRPFQEYSTGGKQRLALARCLMSGAGILLMDEPTRSLDPDAAERFRAVVKDKLRGQGRTIVFTTHQRDEADALADKVVHLT